MSDVKEKYENMLDNFLKHRRNIRETQRTYEEKLREHRYELAYLLSCDILKNGGYFLSKKIEYSIDFRATLGFSEYMAAINSYFPSAELEEIGYSFMNVHYDVLDYAARDVLSAHFTVDYRKSDLGQHVVVRTRN